MTKDRSSAGELPSDGGIGFRIVLAFEDSASELNARALCDRLTARLGGELRFIQCCWNLQSQEGWEVAYDAPASAWPDMIILAMHRADQRVPSVFCQYLEHLARRRHRHATALVALFDEAVDSSGAGADCALEDLRAAASLGRFALFVRGGGTTPAGRSGGIVPVPCDPGPAFRFGQDGLGSRAHSHSGLNE